MWRMIERSDGVQLGKMLRMIMKRHQIYNPDEEMLIAFLPRNNWEERRIILDSMCAILMNEKTDSLK